MKRSIAPQAAVVALWDILASLHWPLSRIDVEHIATDLAYSHRSGLDGSKIHESQFTIPDDTHRSAGTGVNCFRGDLAWDTGSGARIWLKALESSVALITLQPAYADIERREERASISAE